jgi:hypothetical protein
MPSFSRHDIDNFAFQAVRDLKEGTPLQDSVVKLAKDNQMNPEQIKRLVESTNTSAFLDSFKTKTGNQRMVEFDVADASKAIESALDAPQQGMGRDSITITISRGSDEELFSDVANEYEPKVAEYTEKVASNKKPLPTKEEKVSGYISNMYKDSLLDKLAACNYTASDLADDIASSFKGIYSRDKYASFELDALSQLGNKAMPALHMVRNRLGMKKLARNLSEAETYYLADRHVVFEGNNDLLSKVAEIAELTEEHINVSKGLDYLNKKYRA